MDELKDKSFLELIDTVFKKPMFTRDIFEHSDIEVVQELEYEGRKVEVWEEVVKTRRLKVYPK